MHTMCESYERRLEDERTLVEIERQRADARIFDLKESYKTKRRAYDERIWQLESELARKSTAVASTTNEQMNIWAEWRHTSRWVMEPMAEFAWVIITSVYQDKTVLVQWVCNEKLIVTYLLVLMSEYGSCSAEWQLFKGQRPANQFGARSWQNTGTYTILPTSRDSYKPPGPSANNHINPTNGTWPVKFPPLLLPALMMASQVICALYCETHTTTLPWITAGKFRHQRYLSHSTSTSRWLSPPRN